MLLHDCFDKLNRARTEQKRQAWLAEIKRRTREGGDDIHRVSFSRQPIHLAAAMGLKDDNTIVTQRRDMLICLLDAGIHAERVWDEATGRTLLHSMCANGTVPAGDIEALLARGGPVNVTDDAGNTPLHLYLQREPGKAVSLVGLKTLIEHDADVHAVNGDGQSSYQLAKARGLSGACDTLSNYGGDANSASAPASATP